MSKSLINPLWTAYNNIHNEGGEGYNPHDQYVGESDEPLWSKYESQAAKLQRIQNGTSMSDPRYAELETRRQEALAAYKIAFAQGV